MSLPIKINQRYGVLLIDANSLNVVPEKETSFKELEPNFVKGLLDFECLSCCDLLSISRKLRLLN